MFKQSEAYYSTAKFNFAFHRIKFTDIRQTLGNLNYAFNYMNIFPRFGLNNVYVFLM